MTQIGLEEGFRRVRLGADCVSGYGTGWFGGRVPESEAWSVVD